MRQHAVAALNLTQKAMEAAAAGAVDPDATARTASSALIDGVRKFAMDVRDLDIDLIDRINPFGEAYAILAKTMSEESLKQVAADHHGEEGAADARRGARPRAAARSGSSSERGRLPDDHVGRTPGRSAWPKAWPSSPV